MVGLNQFLILGALLFCIGIYGALSKRNVIVLLMCLELMLNGINVTFVGFNRFVARRAWALAGASTILGVGIAFVASLLVMGQVVSGARLDVPFPWLTIGANQSSVIELGLRVDAITAAMLIAVTGVSLLVQIYSWGYLHETEFAAQGHPHVH